MPGTDEPRVSLDEARLRPVGSSGLARLPALARKELREALRDRRTLVTLVLMPLLVYPLLSVGFQQLFFAHVQPHQAIEYRLGFRSGDDLQAIGKYLAWGQQLLEDKRRAEAEATPSPKPPALPAGLPIGPPGANGAEPGAVPSFKLFVAEDLEAAVKDLQLEAGLTLAPNGDLASFDPGDPSTPQRDLAAAIEVLYVSEAPLGEQARIYLQQCFRAANEAFLRERLVALNSKQPAQPVAATYRSLESSVGGPRMNLKTLVPLILILMTITGAVYPAIDLTAGERERGTLELIAAAPVSRFALLLAKYFTVLTVATLTALINLAAMTLTLYASGIAPMLLGEEGLGGLAIVQVFLLTILFAAFFSAVLLSVTSFAR
ncbi:MAG TPA: ABC transporter permease subunit, partial [Pirellulales bacterium]